MPRKKRMSVASPIGEAFANMKVEATREVVLDPEPKAQRSPLMPTRWWENAAQAMEPQRRDPVLVVSHQVAQVLNMGIDRAVDVGERAKADKEWAEGQAAFYRREYEWLREFMRNVRDRIGPIDDNTDMFTRGHREFVVDLARSIDLLEKGLPR